MKAYRATFAYLARYWLDLVKALWLPAALMTAIQLYSAAPLFTAMSNVIALGENPDPGLAAAELTVMGKWLLISLAGAAVAYPMMTVASLGGIILGERLKTPFYLRYGADELRVLAAYVLLVMMLMVIGLVGGLGVALIIAMASVILSAARGLISSLIDLAFNIAITWFRVRLSVLYPATVAKGVIGFNAAWSATRGQALRIFFFYVLVGLTWLPLGLLIAAPFVGRFVPLLSALGDAGVDKAAQRAAMTPILTELAALFAPAGAHFPVLALLLFVGTMVSAAVTNIASGTVWRYLTDRAAPTASSPSAQIAA